MSIPISKPADHFSAMAERINKNPEEFQGAYVIVTPSGDVLSQSFFDPKGDNIQFWGFLSGAVQVAATEAQIDMETKMGLRQPRIGR